VDNLTPAVGEANTLRQAQHQLQRNIALSLPAHISLLLPDVNGRRIKMIDNTDRPKGSYQYYVNTTGMPAGIYNVSLTTHADKLVTPIAVTK